MLDGRTVLLLAAVCVVLAGLAWRRWRLRRHAYLNYRQSSQYSRGIFANTPPTAALHRRGTLAALLRMALYPQRYRPTQPLSVQRPDWDAFFHDDGEARIKMIWFGHSSLLMRVGGTTVFFDPVFAPSVSPLPWMMRRFQAAPAALHELP
ncbi:MBL fold metallo-hydrolase, partial [Conchiformibius steedae]|uniref:MBL fold metallo-hydrolase n=1 Tax=Conchiformibius steedae TaxID=153493 RepID=UPI0034E93995